MKKTLLSFILTFILLVTLGTVSAFAAESNFVTAEYTYTSSDGTETVGLEITAYSGSDTDIYIPSKIGEVPVLKVGDDFLAGNTSVNSVTLGAGIKKIGAGAFSGAANMVCALLNEDIETIGEGAFSDMPVFNSIILWDSVTSIGEGAFVGCPNLTVYCNEGTAAYTFVTSNGIDYEILNPEAEPEIYTVDGVTYYIMNGEANAVSFDNSVLDLVIPATVEGYPLTDIRMAFMESKLVSVELPTSLRKIADQAFHACYDLASVYIPEGVENIGMLSFARCIALKNVELPHSVYEIGGGAFGLCLGLEEVVINSNISQISDEMFYGCECLEIVEIPESVVSIGFGAFNKCSSLTNITFPQGLVEIDERAFNECSSLTSITFPQGLIEIDESAFFSCSGLTEIVLPNSVQTIGNKAFSGCSNVTTLVLSSQLKYIPYGVFESLGISRLDLPSGIEEIGGNAFFGCQNLKYVYIPESMKSIGDYAFCNCLILASVIIPDTVTFIGNAAFSSTATLFVEEHSYAHSVAVEQNYTYHLLSEDQAPKTYYDQGVTYMIIDDQAIVADFDDTYDEIVIPETVLDCPVVDIGVTFSGSTIKSITLPGNLSSICFFAFRGCTELETVIILDGVTEIGKEAFAKCVSLKNLSLPETLVRIVAYAFSGCCNLENVVIPKSVCQIESYAFNNCKGLKTITLSESMTKIYDGLFYGCSGIENITLPDSITEIGEYSFSGCSSLISINIPDSLTQISKGVFNECVSLKNVEIPRSVTKIGAEAFRRCVGLQIIDIPNTVTIIETDAFCLCTGLESINIPQNITTINEGVFLGCRGLKSITIPDQVIKIGNAAFSGCSNLESITIPESVERIGNSAFSHCYRLTSVVIPENVTQIGFNAFSSCSELKSVVIPKNVTQMGSEVFYDCYNLESVIIEDGLIELEDRTFKGCINLKYVVLPKSISSVGIDVFPDKVVLCLLKDSYIHTYAENAKLPYYIIDEKNVPTFYYRDGIEYYISNNEAVAFRFDNSVCNVVIPNEIAGFIIVGLGHAFMDSLIESVVLPESLTEIGERCFSGCSKLKDITIPESVTKIGDSAFQNCSSLQSIVIPENVTSIGDSAFQNCSGLQSIVIPENVTSIGRWAFQNCSSLQSVVIPENVTSIGKWAFQNCSSLQSIVIPENVTSIGDSAFQNCSSLENITIPKSVTQIGDSAFSGCSKLTSINLPQNITEIRNHTFNGCSGLERITMPESVTKIGYKAFWECRNLNAVTILGNVTEIEEYAFVYCDKLNYIVLPNSVISLNEYSFHNTVLGVYENSYAHNFAVENDLLYFVIRETPNPEISYGTSITGTVRYDDGTPAVGVSVELLYDDGEVKESVTTDANGEYSFTYAEVGRYTIRVNDGSNTASEQVSVKRKNVFDVILTGETDLVLKKGYTVSGNISGEGSITVTITDKDGNVIDSVVTENGLFEFENIPNGEYIIKTENADGSVTVEVTVFGGDVALENITIEKAQVYVTLFGKVVVKDRENEEHAREWAQVTVYNSDGVVVASGKTDENGNYSFPKLPVGEYTIRVEATEMREDEYYGYIRPHVLKGYAYADALESGEYEVETIVLTEEESVRVSLAGKVTAQGEHQACEVILMNENRDELARFVTKKNGKYQFDNVRDGYYILCAITEHYGAGFTEITVKNGVVYGETDIRVYKSDRVSAHEAIMFEIAECEKAAEAEAYREKVMSEKNFYDSLPDKEKKMFSPWYIAKLDKLVRLLSGYEFTCDGAEVDRGGLIVSEEEVSNGANPHFTISVVEMDKWEKNQNGIETDEDYYQTFVEEAAGDNELAQYYDITLECEKNGKTYEITDVKKHTDTTGRIRLTMPVPDKFKGHKNYAFVHVHNGVPTTLVDLDDDPDTITFEIDRFSTFALMFNDEEQVDLSDYATLSISENTLTATSTTDATLFVATYNAQGKMTDVKLTTLYADTPVEVNVTIGQKAFVLDADMAPLCEEVVVG